MIHSFDPQGDTVYITSDTTTSRVALDIPDDAAGCNLRISVNGSDFVKIEQGDSSVEAADASSLTMLGNSVEVFPLKSGTTHVAVIAGTAGSIVGITVGRGV